MLDLLDKREQRVVAPLPLEATAAPSSAHLVRVFNCLEEFEPVEHAFVVGTQEEQVVKHRLENIEQPVADRSASPVKIWEQLERMHSVSEHRGYSAND